MTVIDGNEIRRQEEKMEELAMETLESLNGLKIKADFATDCWARGQSYGMRDLINFTKEYVEKHEFNDDMVLLIPDTSKPFEYARLVRDYVEVRREKMEGKSMEQELMEQVESLKGDEIMMNEKLNELLEETEEIKMVTCDCCGMEHRKDECRQTADGAYVCPDCVREHYRECDICNELYFVTELNYIDNTIEHVCDACKDRWFAQCCDCGEWDRRSNLIESESGDYYCETHYYENFTTCDNCGWELHRSEIEWVGDEALCYECYSKKGCIKGYHADVAYDLNTCKDEVVTSSTLTIGIEHEVGGYTDYARGYLDVMGEDYGCNDAHFNNVVLMEDGSVDGFEIVSNPMTMRYFKEVFMPLYRKGLDYLKEHNFKGVDAGGIHIHFNGIRTQEQLARMCNILYGSIDDIQSWCKITRRTQRNMHWCSMTDRQYSTQEILEEGYDTCTNDRHTALNYDGSRTDTHELRIFNSTLDADGYMTCVEVLVSLLDFTSINTERGLWVTTRDYVKYIKDNKETYPLVYKRMDDSELFEKYDLNGIDIESIVLTDEDRAFIESIVNKVVDEEYVTHEAVCC